MTPMTSEARESIRPPELNLDILLHGARSRIAQIENCGARREHVRSCAVCAAALDGLYAAVADAAREIRALRRSRAAAEEEA